MTTYTYPKDVAIPRKIGPRYTYDISNTIKASLHCQITVTTTAMTLSALLAIAAAANPSDAECVALAAGIPDWVTSAFITPEVITGAIAVRYKAGGGTPTISIGQPIYGGQSWPIQGLLTINGIKLISLSGSVLVSVEVRG